MPIHARLPLVKETINLVKFSPFSAAVTHRSGLKVCGSGNRSGSICTK